MKILSHPSSNGSKTFGVVEKDNSDGTVDVKVRATFVHEQILSTVHEPGRDR